MSSKPAKTIASGLHPRNRHQGRYDFDRLIGTCPPLAGFVIVNPYGKRSIDFADPAAVRILNQALLAQLYGVCRWEIPPGYLCPPIPGRADYLHGLADLLAQDLGGRLPKGERFRALDIGTGASAIYPLLGHLDYGWRFVGTDIDSDALASARRNVQQNALDEVIELRHQPSVQHIYEGIIGAGEHFDVTLCNPPFHASAEEAAAGSRRKWKNLGRLDPNRRLPALNFGGQSNELWCRGGEIAFLRRMAAESKAHAETACWFSSLVSKGANVAPLCQQLKTLGTSEVRVVEMAQGQKRSRFVAWTYLPSAARRARLNHQA